MCRLKSDVFDELRRWIIKGHFSEGQYISPSEVCALLKVSPVPVREVLIRLSERGLLCWEKNRGFKIASCNISECVSILKMKRFLFEGAINRLNPSSISHDHLAEFDKNIKEYLSVDIDWITLEDIFIEYNKIIMTEFEFNVFRMSCDKVHCYHRQMFYYHPQKISQRFSLVKMMVENTTRYCKGKVLESGFKFIDDDIENILLP